MNKNKSKNADAELQQLRDLLLGPNSDLAHIRTDLEHLRSQFADKEAMIASLNPLLSDLLERTISDNKEDVAGALAPVMGEAIKRQVIETREEVVDALYPIIGKTIRKSVAEAMSDQFSSVNKKIENSIRRSFLPTWLQAKLLGMKRAELLIKDSLPFRIEQIFVIHTETGLLIAHVAADQDQNGNSVNQELISGMLTAIRDFVAHAFQSHDHELQEIHYGQSKIVLDLGRYAYLAVVVSGYEPENFYKEVGRLNQKIYNRYYRALRQFQGDVSDFENISSPLRGFMESYNGRSQAAEKKKSRPYLLYLFFVTVTLVVLILGLLFLPGYWRDYQLQNAIAHKLQTVPHMQEQKVSHECNDGRVTLHGQVNSFALKAKIDSIAQRVQGVRQVDNRIAVVVLPATEQEILGSVRRRLAAYDSLAYFKPRLMVQGEEIVIHGFVPDARLKREIGLLLSEVHGVRVVTNNLVVLNAGELVEIRSFLRENSILFASRSATFDEAQQNKLETVVAVFRVFAGENAKLVVRGYANDYKDFSRNVLLSKLRLQTVLGKLEEMNITAEVIIAVSYGDKVPELIDVTGVEANNAPKYRVEFDLMLGRN